MESWTSVWAFTTFTPYAISTVCNQLRSVWSYSRKIIQNKIKTKKTACMQNNFISRTPYLRHKFCALEQGFRSMICM